MIGANTNHQLANAFETRAPAGGVLLHRQFVFGLFDFLHENKPFWKKNVAELARVQTKCSLTKFGEVAAQLKMTDRLRVTGHQGCKPWRPGKI